MAFAAFVLRPLLESFAGVELHLVPVFGLLLVTFVLKSGNYFLIARLLVLWPPRVRLVVNAVVNVVALGLAVAGCATAGLPGAAVTAVAIEAVFAVLALLAMQRIRPRG
jgi:orotate phosphoribosyltransferase